MTSAASDASASRRIRSVLAIRSFRRLLISGYFCSVGDWLALLALSGMATQLMHGYLAQSFAFSGVVLTQLAPGLIFAPLGGILADRFDRRKVMVVMDLMRCALFVSIAVVGTLWWLYTASFLVGCMSMLWIPAKDAAVPNLMRRKDQVETANQIGLVITYGLAVVSGAGLYAIITGLGTTFHVYSNTLGTAIVVVGINGALYLLSALLIATRIPEISGRGSLRHEPGDEGPGFVVMFRDGVRFAMTTPLVRGLIIGMVGAFAAGGAVIGAGRQYANSLMGGNASFGALFVALFLGLAVGMGSAPKLARRLSHNRLFGIAIVFAGLLLALTAVSPQLIVSLGIVVLIGACAGAAFLTGVTIIGTQVDDAVRGRVNAVYQSLMKVILFAATIIVPLLVGLMRPRHIAIFGNPVIIDGSRPVLFGAGLLAALAGVFAYRQMGDRQTGSILANLLAAIRQRPRPTEGWLVAVEGSTPSDTSAQARILADWLADRGKEIVLASDPALEEQRMRTVVASAHLTSPRAQALVAAAVRADVVEQQVRPALERGAVVVMERYVDSALAQVSALGGLETAELEGLADWATGRLRPDLTVLLDRDPASVDGALSVLANHEDETTENMEHSWRVRQLLTEMADADPDRYVVVDADGDPAAVAERVRTALSGVLANGKLGIADTTAEPAPVRAVSTVWDQLVGQEPVVEELTAAAQAAAEIVAGTASGQTIMTHAWLFTGPPGSGRSTAARAFAAALQCRTPGAPGCGECSACHTAMGGTHADVHRVVPEGLSISVEEMRSLVQLAARRPVTGEWQIVIIEDADRLTEGAANALLKSVEEPAERTVFLLCAPSDHPEDVTVTIRSRCRVLNLRTPRPEAIADVLMRRDGIDAERARWAGAVCGGHVGRARRLATDDAVRERRDAVLRISVSLRRMSDVFACADDLVRTAESEAAGVSGERDEAEKEELRIAMGADGTGKGTSAANRSANAAVKQLETRQKRRATRTQRDSLDLALVDLAGFYRDVLAVNLGAGEARPNHPDRAGDIATLAAASTPELTLRRLEAVLACRDAITRNVKPRIAVEAMLATLRE